MNTPVRALASAAGNREVEYPSLHTAPYLALLYRMGGRPRPGSDLRRSRSRGRPPFNDTSTTAGLWKPHSYDDPLNSYLTNPDSTHLHSRSSSLWLP